MRSIVMKKVDRMLELLWFVMYSGEFPRELAYRLPGNAGWNRHTMALAIEEGYVEMTRANTRRYRVRSVHITDAGIAYIAERAPERMPLLLSRQSEVELYHISTEKILRANAIAIGLVMAANAGAIILPKEKPSLLNRPLGTTKPISSDEAYYYSVRELRNAIEDYDSEIASKTSRMLGVIVRGRDCFFLYYTGSSRIYWRRNEEENSVAMVEALLMARGFPCDNKRQVIIGNNMHVAQKIFKQGLNSQSRYLSVSDYFSHCHYLTNDKDGDELLRVMINEKLADEFESRVMIPAYREPDHQTRAYDAVTLDGRQAVILNYQFDLLALLRFNSVPEGFKENPIILCLDYQADTIQGMASVQVEVRAIPERLFQ